MATTCMRGWCWRLRARPCCCVPPRAAFFGVTGAAALKFYEVDPAAGLLLLPLLGYAAFGALLLNLSLGGSSASVEVGGFRV